ncbi:MULTISPECIES: hypothetical protein [unclassified Streptomyces]|uniref:hypothetical protein n=1 Tax=unclassified Streptomyces TaxID=2593676 RepID=UPI0038090014
MIRPLRSTFGVSVMPHSNSSNGNGSRRSVPETKLNPTLVSRPDSIRSSSSASISLSRSFRASSETTSGTRTTRAVVPKLIAVNPDTTAHSPAARQIRAQESKYPALDGCQTTPCAPLWTVYAATGMRRSEALGMKWPLVN